jgi:glycosyltransferase involved in cell wall biosynthesis
MPKVLIISLHFPPSAASGSFRILGFCHHLPKFGWQPLVVACPQVPGEPLDPDLASLIPEHTHVQYVSYPHGPLARLSARLLYRARASRIDRHLSWSLAALQTCRRMIQQYQADAILTSGPPHTTHLLGLKLKREFNLPLIADFRDPWITSSTTRGLARIGQKLEQTVFTGADQIIANAPKAHEAFQLAHPRQSHKIVAISNGFDPDSAPPPNLAIDKIEILHTGELYHGRDPKPLLSALRLAEKSCPQTRWQLTFMGRANSLIPESLPRNCTSPVIAEPQAPYSAAKARMRSAHILLLLDTPGRQIGVPAKLYEYIGAGRPLLVLAEQDSDTATITRQSGLPHRIVSPTDPAAIADALVDLTEIAASQQPTHHLRAPSPFTRRTLTQQLASLLDKTQTPSIRNQPERKAA